MELRDLGTPAQLWRRWALLAAADAGRGAGGYEIRRTDGCAHLGRDEAWVRLRRLGGNRAVLWGHHPDVVVADTFGDDVADLAPDWSYEVDSAHVRRDVGFLAWHAHGSWSSVPTRLPSQVAQLLEELGSEDDVRATWRRHWPAASDDEIDAALNGGGRAAFATVMGTPAATRAARQTELADAWSSQQLSQTATAHLREQIHLQMRAARELGGRGHPARPRLLRQWARVNAVGRPFQHAICALGSGATPGLVAGADNSGLTEHQVRSVENVLMELRMAETDESSGAWLFARAVGDGNTARLERAFDCWPSWYVAPGAGPTMSALHFEMAQRTPAWRPSWSTLLPAERF